MLRQQETKKRRLGGEVSGALELREKNAQKMRDRSQ
jgi:hypothetical protein